VGHILSGMEKKPISRFPTDNILRLGRCRIVSKFLPCHILSYQFVFEVWSVVARRHAQRYVYSDSVIAIFPHGRRVFLNRRARASRKR